MKIVLDDPFGLRKTDAQIMDRVSGGGPKMWLETMSENLEHRQGQQDMKRLAACALFAVGWGNSAKCVFNWKRERSDLYEDVLPLFDTVAEAEKFQFRVRSVDGSVAPFVSTRTYVPVSAERMILDYLWTGLPMLLSRAAFHKYSRVYNSTFLPLCCPLPAAETEAPYYAIKLYSYNTCYMEPRHGLRHETALDAPPVTDPLLIDSPTFLSLEDCGSALQELMELLEMHEDQRSDHSR